MFDLTDVKVALASISGLGNWVLEIDTVLHVLISAASLFYILLRCVKLLKGKK
jgi:hypothetical protein